MKIEALIVCVGFDDLLAITLPSVIDEVDRVMVVTSLTDVATAKCASRLGAWTLATDAFYIHGAAFNKAAALNEALASGLLDLDEWLMVLRAHQQRYEVNVHVSPTAGHGATRHGVIRSAHP